MMKLCEPEIPEKYWIKLLTYKCENCGLVFDSMLPNGNDLVKLEEIGGNNVRWLPLYGEGGYIDLLIKLTPNHSPNDAITMEKSRIFMEKLMKYSETGETGNGFNIGFRKKECRDCKTNNITTISEEILENPKLDWLQISCNLIHCE